MSSTLVIAQPTYGIFSDSREVNDGDVGTAAVRLRLDPATTVTGLSASPLVPSQSVVAPISVTNDGTIQMRYAMTTSLVGDQGAQQSGLDALAGALKLDVRQGGRSCTADTFDAEGPLLYGAAAPAGAVSAPNQAASGQAGDPLKVLGDPARGQQDGDRVLDPGASEQLCLRLTLPADAPSTTQSLSAHLAITFAAEQTMGN